MDPNGAGEFAAIERLRSVLPPPPPGETWIGDDAAVLAGGLLLATDAVVEGVHFVSTTPAADVGWKAVVANVSDVAAMGGEPQHLVVTVAAPAGTDLDALYEGVSEACRAYDCAVVGGDLSSGPALFVSVAVTGLVPDGAAPVLRSGAGAGDAVFLTGELGRSAASGWTRRACARVAEGGAARVAGATAMIDVSDGLGADLGRVLVASDVGFQASVELDFAAGGEDYELVFTAPDPDRVMTHFEERGLRPPLLLGLLVPDRSARPPALGWEHGLA